MGEEEGKIAIICKLNFDFLLRRHHRFNGAAIAERLFRDVSCWLRFYGFQTKSFQPSVVLDALKLE